MHKELQKYWGSEEKIIIKQGSRLGVTNYDFLRNRTPKNQMAYRVEYAIDKSLLKNAHQFKWERFVSNIESVVHGKFHTNLKNV